MKSPPLSKDSFWTAIADGMLSTRVPAVRPLAPSSVSQDGRHADRAHALHGARGLRARLRGDAARGRRARLRGRRALRPARPRARARARLARRARLAGVLGA